jgi:hypothetical protein
MNVRPGSSRHPCEGNDYGFLLAIAGIVEVRRKGAFEEIQRFVEKHGSAPRHGEDHDIFERLYAVRLDRLRALKECRSLLRPMDHQGLLSEKVIVDAVSPEAIDDGSLFLFLLSTK